MKSYTLLVNPTSHKRSKSNRRTKTMKKSRKSAKRTRKNPATAMVINPKKKVLSQKRINSIKKDLRKKTKDGEKYFYSITAVANKHHLSVGYIRKFMSDYGIKRGNIKSRIVRKKTTGKKTTGKKTTRRKTTRKTRVSQVSVPKKGYEVYYPVRKGKIVKSKKKINVRRRKTVKPPYIVLANPRPNEYFKLVGWATLGFVGTKLISNVLGDMVIKKTTKIDQATGVPQENKLAPYIKPLLDVAITAFLGFTKIGNKQIPRRGELALGAGMVAVNDILRDFVAPKIPAINKDGTENKVLAPIKKALTLGDSGEEAVIVLPNEALNDYVYAQTKNLPTVTDYSVGDYVNKPSDYLADYVKEPKYSDAMGDDIDVDDLDVDEPPEVFDEPPIM